MQEFSIYDLGFDVVMLSWVHFTVSTNNEAIKSRRSLQILSTQNVYPAP